MTACTAQAQISIKVTEGNESYTSGSQNSLLVTVYEAEVKDVEKLLKQELKGMKGKVSNKKNEFFADDCEEKRMGDNTFDVYAKVTSVGEGEV